MSMPSRRALLASASLLATPAFAQGSGGAWPNGPIRLVAPFPPGGSVDTVCRLIQGPLSAEFGVPVIVENRGGASGSLGTAQVARAAPDGQTFVLVFDTHVTNPTLIANMPFDTRRDLAPVLLLGTAPNLLATHRTRPWRSLGEVITAAKAEPDRISYGTIGNGSLAHLGMSLAQKQGGFRVSHVPYRGGGPLAVSAMAGETDLVSATGTIFVEHLRQGVLRPLAVLGPRRVTSLPGVPTMAEAGLPGVEAQAFWGLLAPAGTPPGVIERVADATKRATLQPEIRERLVNVMGIELAHEGPDAFASFIDRQIETWGRVIRENGIRAD